MPILKAFDRGQPITVVCVNKATVPFERWRSGKSFEDLVAALQAWADLFALGDGKGWGGWGSDCRCQLVIDTALRPGCWGAVFTDNADVAGALGYHDTTPDGLPLMHNFVQTTIRGGGPVSITASHELGEALADPCANLSAEGPRGVIYAYEVCDAVEATSFPVNGIAMSNFQFPAWFEAFKRQRYDYLGKCARPFQILAGGYMPVFYRGRWTQIFGRGGEARYSAKEARRSIRRGEQPIKSSRCVWA